MGKIWDFLKDEDGLELTEYAVMGALIIVVGAAAIWAVGGKIKLVFGEILAAMDEPAT